MEDKELEEILLGKEDYDQIEKDFGIKIKDIEKSFGDYRPKTPLKYVKMTEGILDLKYEYETDSGFDLRSLEDITIPPFGRTLIPTGIRLDIPEGFEVQIRTKSGQAIDQGLMVLNSPGTADAGYTGEIKVIIFNTNQTSFTITKGMKVGQAVLCPVICGKYVELEQVKEIKSKDRGSAGFGSTGI